MGAVMPGSRFGHITLLARREICHLHRNDFVVIWGGANDINRNESSTGLRHIRNLALRNKHTNIIAITPPLNFSLFCIHLIHRGCDPSDMELANAEIRLQIYMM